MSAENGDLNWTPDPAPGGWSTEFITDRHSAGISAVSDVERREEKNGNKQW
jgi:hypothetical protein